MRGLSDIEGTQFADSVKMQWSQRSMAIQWVRELWRYRELFYFFVWRDIKVRYKQTVVGAGWAIIQPFFTMVVFTLFFGKFAKMPSDGIPYPIFYYSALLPWTYFSGALTQSANSLVLNTNLITKVYFPRATIPASAALSRLLDFAIASVILFGMMAYYQIQPGWGLLLWPLLIIPLVVLAVALGMFLSALNVKYRDIRYVVPSAIQLWLFVTPIIYPTSIIPERFRVFAALNPLTAIIEGFRASLLPTRQMDWQLYGISAVMIFVIFVLSIAYFRSVERSFADII